MFGPVKRTSLVVLTLSLASACRSATEGSAFERHRSPAIWGAAVGDVFDHPPQRDLLYGVAGLTLVTAPFDESLSHDGSEDQTITNGKTVPGDSLAIALGGTALAYGAWQWGSSGDGVEFEIAAESLAATQVAVEVLKRLTSRERPDHSDHESFPSGHTAFAFAGATLLANAIEDDTDGRANHLGYLFYLPALYVAIDRVEAGKHYPSDVGVGALIGIFVADWVRSVHVPCADEDRPTIYPSRKRRLTLRLEPCADEHSRGLSLVWSF